MAESIADVAVGAERAEIGSPDEALRVDQELSAVACERGERLHGEVGSREGADMDEAGVADGLDRPLCAPGLADRVLAHDPPVALVVEAVRGRRRRLVPRDWQREALDVRSEHGPVVARARDGDRGVGVESGKGARGVEDRSPGPWVAPSTTSRVRLPMTAIALMPELLP